MVMDLESVGRYTRLGVISMLGIAACGSDSGADPVADSGSTAQGSDDATSNPTSAASDSDPSATDATDPTDPTDPSATDATDPSGTDGTSTDGGSTTGEPMYCGLDDMPGEPGPWFEILHMGEPLASGSTLTLECGSQGSLMFWLSTTQGGVTPGGNDEVTYEVTLDVPGFDDLSPTGHFYQNLAYSLYVGCERVIGGVLGGIPVLPPDALVEPQMVDGLPATLHVELVGTDSNAVFDVEVVLSIPADLAPDNCFGAG